MKFFRVEGGIKKLQETGVAGLVGYGILNALYYTIAAVVVWYATGGGQRLPSPGSETAAVVVGEGIKASAERFVKVGEYDDVNSRGFVGTVWMVTTLSFCLL